MYFFLLVLLNIQLGIFINDNLFIFFKCLHIFYNIKIFAFYGIPSYVTIRVSSAKIYYIVVKM